MNQKNSSLGKNKGFFHKPVLLNEVIQFLDIKPNELYIDATCGGGGHTEAILKKNGKVFALDFDPEAVSFVKKRLLLACPNASFKMVNENFSNLKKILDLHKIEKAAGIIFDLGTSLHQLKSENRGFSFNINDPLDMRMNPKLQVKAADLLNGLGKKELIKLFITYGEEKFSHEIVKEILKKRMEKLIESTEELARIVESVYAVKRVKTKIHPATKVFQALRIAVNDEINNLKAVLPQALGALKEGGRLVVISFHGLEDKVVKSYFKEMENINKLKILTKKPISPSFKEVNNNPNSRSAKLRCGEKI
ncbi:16S rRNA (cytosine(1402)-N(4))-methyltransferase RsmH [Patescibacteria group bacterium]